MAALLSPTRPRVLSFPGANITLHMSATNQKLTSEVLTNAVTNAGISGITEAQAQIMVNNALKLLLSRQDWCGGFCLGIWRWQHSEYLLY